MTMIEHRLYDERAGELGPYYVSFDRANEDGSIDVDGVFVSAIEDGPLPILEFGLDQHERWARTGNLRARHLFLAQAKWAARAQVSVAGVRGCYPFPSSCHAFGCNPGYRSATAQSEAISLLLRAYEETGEELYLERAKDASIALTVDLRDGGVAWQDGDDLFFEHKAGLVPSHVLSGWICSLWGLLELSRVAKLPHIEALYKQSLATLEKYLPCYDTGSWSYESLLAAPSGFRRFSNLRRHLFHVAQLDVLLSMTKNDLFSVVAERWRRYVASTESRIRLLVNAAAAIPNALMGDELTIPGGARSIV
jgi:heparosan-N-sulfate-glucuronate 5-epimerase